MNDSNNEDKDIIDGGGLDDNKKKVIMNNNRQTLQQIHKLPNGRITPPPNMHLAPRVCKHFFNNYEKKRYIKINYQIL